MSAKPLLLLGEQSIAQAEQHLADHIESGAPVVDQRGKLQGILTISDIQRIPFEEREQRLVKEIVNRDILIVSPDDTLDEALEELTTRR